MTNDNFIAIQMFMARFPTLRKNDLYLAGSGYAGITAPYLAMKIFNENESPFWHTKTNLKGLILGNPCTAADECYATGSFK